MVNDTDKQVVIQDNVPCFAAFKICCFTISHLFYITPLCFTG
jgi:hypothetical protein